MANELVQFRADEVTKAKAIGICERLGIDLPTYMRICITKLVQENGIPFSMKLNDQLENPAIAALREANRIAEENGISDMTLEEINEEIAAARRERDNRRVE